MSTADRTVLLFPRLTRPAHRRTLRRSLLAALRHSESPVIIDFSSHCTLNQDDIELLLDCLAQTTGRDAQLILAVESPVVRILLAVARISSIVPVLSSLESALRYPPLTPEKRSEQFSMNPSELDLSIGVPE